MKMVIDRDTFNIKTDCHCQMLDITAQIKQAVEKSGIIEGTVTVFCPHTTAAITINENADADVIHDVLLTLKSLVPTENPKYKHCEGNSDAHVKCSTFGASETIIIAEGQLVLGTWQGIYFCEFDGPRSRKVIYQIMGN